MPNYVKYTLIYSWFDLYFLGSLGSTENNLEHFIMTYAFGPISIFCNTSLHFIIQLAASLHLIIQLAASLYLIIQMAASLYLVIQLAASLSDIIQ